LLISAIVQLHVYCDYQLIAKIGEEIPDRFGKISDPRYGFCKR